MRATVEGHRPGIDPDVPQHASTVRGHTARILWLTLAYVSLGIGIVGIVLPVLPTTPFVLLSAFAADRGSPRLHAWLLGHRVFGPPIRDWRESRSVSRRGKVAAVTVMSLSLVIMIFAAPLFATVIGGTIMATVATWLWMRPEPVGPGALEE